MVSTRLLIKTSKIPTNNGSNIVTSENNNSTSLVIWLQQQLQLQFPNQLLLQLQLEAHSFWLQVHCKSIAKWTEMFVAIWICWINRNRSKQQQRYVCSGLDDSNPHFNGGNGANTMAQQVHANGPRNYIAIESYLARLRWKFRPSKSLPMQQHQHQQLFFKLAENFASELRI